MRFGSRLLEWLIKISYSGNLQIHHVFCQSLWYFIDMKGKIQLGTSIAWFFARRISAKCIGGAK